MQMQNGCSTSTATVGITASYVLPALTTKKSSSASKHSVNHVVASPKRTSSTRQGCQPALPSGPEQGVQHATTAATLLSSQSATTQLQLQLAQQMLAFATQQATLLQQALPFMLPVCPSKVSEKLTQVLDDLHAKPVIERLREAGFADYQAQKACLEYKFKTGKSDLDPEVVLNWTKQNADIAELNRPVSLQDILKCCDLGPAVQRVGEQLPGMPMQTIELAVTFCLGDPEAAVQLLTNTNRGAAAGKSCTTQAASAASQNSGNEGGAEKGVRVNSWLENTGELADCMSSALNIANELKVFTDKLVALQQHQQQSPLTSANGQPVVLTHLPAGPLTSILPQAPSETAGEGVIGNHTSGVPGNLLLPVGGLPMVPPSGPVKGDGPAGGEGGLGGGSNTLPVPSAEQQHLQEEVVQLKKHKEWADSRIKDLIRKACETEKPLAEENKVLREEITRLRQEKKLLESRTKEFEDSVQKLKDSTYREAAARREFERRVQVLEAELPASLLREQELQCQLQESQAGHKAAMKKLASADKQKQRALDEKAEAERVAQGYKDQLQAVNDKSALLEKQVSDKQEALEAEEKLRMKVEQLMEQHQETFMVEKASLEADLDEKVHELAELQVKFNEVQQEVLQKTLDLRAAQAKAALTTAPSSPLQDRAPGAGRGPQTFEMMASGIVTGSGAGGRVFMNGHWSAPDFLGRAATMPHLMGPGLAAGSPGATYMSPPEDLSSKLKIMTGAGGATAGTNGGYPPGAGGLRW